MDFPAATGRSANLEERACDVITSWQEEGESLTHPIAILYALFPSPRLQKHEIESQTDRGFTAKHRRREGGGLPGLGPPESMER